jgi:hypothetical protein
MMELPKKEGRIRLFCQKEAKNFCLFGARGGRLASGLAEVFWFFFAKKNILVAWCGGMRKCIPPAFG